MFDYFFTPRCCLPPPPPGGGEEKFVCVHETPCLPAKSGVLLTKPHACQQNICQPKSPPPNKSSKVAKSLQAAQRIFLNRYTMLSTKSGKKTSKLAGGGDLPAGPPSAITPCCRHAHKTPCLPAKSKVMLRKGHACRRKTPRFRHAHETPCLPAKSGAMLTKPHACRQNICQPKSPPLDKSSKVAKSL